MDILYLEDSGNHGERVTDNAHLWTRLRVARVARLRERFIQKARAEGYDYVMFVDDDLLLASDTMVQMLEASGDGWDVVFGVFWTTWKGSESAQPQVWDHHPYGFDPARDLVNRLRRRESQQVNGGGACTLLRVESLPSICYWPPIPGLWAHPDFWGEDRHFCIRASCAGLQMLALATVRIHHAFGAPDRTKAALDRAAMSLGIDL